MEEGFQLILKGLGIDWKNDPHFQDTPLRAARAWYNELCRGLTQPAPRIRVFPHEGDTGMVLLKSIPVKSMCAHHLLPFVGVAHVAYIGDNQLLGLSKLSRIVDYHARRPQVQENLTREVASHLANLTMRDGHGGCGVIIKASHMCMALRGVNHHGEMVTSALRGEFHHADVKAEFLQLVGDL